MSRYFSDLDDGKTRYIDIIGTELTDVKMVSGEAIGLLASVFNDRLPDTSDSTFVVNVRNEVGRNIFTTTLMLQSAWLDTTEVQHIDLGAHEGLPSSITVSPGIVVPMLTAPDARSADGRRRC
jgi:hypothetical protein